MKKAIVLLAEGFEEVEAVTPIDYLRRAGIAVTTAAVNTTVAGGSDVNVTGARGITVQADTTLRELVQRGEAEASSWDAVIVPGGMPGAAHLAASTETAALLGEMVTAGKWVCAICAAPALVLAPLGLLDGRRFTCYPGMEEKVSNGKWTDDRVVIDGSTAVGGIITSRGAGTAGAFAAAIIEQLLGKSEETKIAQAVLLS